MCIRDRVYIADNVKEVVPEFLLLLKGILDCPDMPLNVSRSALQNDGYVEKMNAYITKKVADKLNQLFKTDRSAFECFWDDSNIFIKYGCMKEEKLYDCLLYTSCRSALNSLRQRNVMPLRHLSRRICGAERRMCS